MDIRVPVAGQQVAGAFMDSALLHGAVAAFYRDPSVLSPWDKYALAMVTLSLWFHRGLKIQNGLYEGNQPFDCALRELGDVRAHPTKREDYQDRLRGTAAWAMRNVTNVRQALEKMQSDPSYGQWIGWSVTYAWEEHRQRLGGLIDEPMAEPVGKVLGLSTKEAVELVQDAKNQTYVGQWIAAGAANAPEEVIKGFLVSALLRGKVNHDIRSAEGTQYAFHPFRYAILRVGEALGGCSFPETALWLGSMIVNGAFSLRGPRERAVSWAENVRLIRLAIADKEKPLKIDPSKTGDESETEAANIIRNLGLKIPSRTINFGVGFAVDCGVELLGEIPGVGTGLRIYDYISKFFSLKRPSEVVADKIAQTPRHLMDLGKSPPGHVIFFHE